MTAAVPISSSRAAAQAHLLEPLARFLAIDGATDIAINRPGVVFVETHEGWTRHEAPELNDRALRRIATSIASALRLPFDDQCPEFAATLPGGERLQCVAPPRTEKGSILITVRVPPRRQLSLDDLSDLGLFGEDDQTRRGDIARLVDAIAERKTIVVSGGTGTGKTTLMRALASLIPTDERIVTIEDTPELTLPDHENLAPLYYPADDRAQAKERVRSVLRMRPDRILLAETRGSEAFDFIDAAMSGHPGGMTSVHASSVAAALDRLAMLARQDAAGRGMEFGDMLRLVRGAVDLVVVLERTPSGRRVTAMESVE